MKTMTDNPQTIPGFKCVEMMRAIRDKRDHAMETMTRDERLAFLGVTPAVSKDVMKSTVDTSHHTLS